MIENKGYHAHIYYNPETRPKAERLRETIAAKFAVKVGELSDEPRGPHPSRNSSPSSRRQNSRTSCRG